MAARKKPTAKTEAAVDFSISPALIKWAVGIVSGILGVIILWFSVWDRIDARWRLEATQKATDAKVESDLKAVAAKAEADTKAAQTKLETDLAKYKEADRRAGAWTLYVVQDFRAAAEARWAQDCVERKRPVDVCRELEAKANESRDLAKKQRDAAMDASKGGP